VRADVETHIPLTTVIAACHRSPAIAGLIIIDACYSGAALIRPERDLDDTIPSGVEATKVRQILVSGSPDEPVLDGGGSGHSVFTQALLDVLGGVAGVGEQPDQRIEFDALLFHLRRDVPSRLGRPEQHTARDLLPEGIGQRGEQTVMGGNLRQSRPPAQFTLVPQAPRLPQEIVRDLLAADGEVRSSAIDRLGRRGSAEAEAVTLLRVEKLVALLANERECVDAATSLGSLGHPHAREPLSRLLLGSSSVYCRGAAARALGQLGDRRAAVDLQKALADHGPDHFVRYDAVKALGSLLGAEAIPILVSQFEEDPNPEPKMAIVDVFGSLVDPRSWDLLERAARHNNEGIRASAMGALVEARHPEAWENVSCALLEDESENVQHTAATALGTLGDLRAVDALIQVLANPNASLQARRPAIHSLGQLGDPRAMPALIEALGESDSSLRWGAAWALGELGDARAVESLHHLLEIEQDEGVRRTVLAALSKLEGAIPPSCDS
jgi:HEAT repeat protein